MAEGKSLEDSQCGGRCMVDDQTHCGWRSPSGWLVCTLPPGHSGDHIACGLNDYDEHDLEIWSDRPMTEYKIRWEIEVEAESPEAAARLARRVQLDPASTATVFYVEGPCDVNDFIDLEETD